LRGSLVTVENIFLVLSLVLSQQDFESTGNHHGLNLRVVWKVDTLGKLQVMQNGEF
jgi:hypothetical protein